jgi:hypothetical protein
MENNIPPFIADTVQWHLQTSKAKAGNTKVEVKYIHGASILKECLKQNEPGLEPISILPRETMTITQATSATEAKGTSREEKP